MRPGRQETFEMNLAQDSGAPVTRRGPRALGVVGPEVIRRVPMVRPFDIQLPCLCHAIALSLPCHCHIFAISLPCHCLSLPCHCHAIAMSLPCHCHIFAILGEGVHMYEAMKSMYFGVYIYIYIYIYYIYIYIYYIYIIYGGEWSA